MPDADVAAAPSSPTAKPPAIETPTAPTPAIETPAVTAAASVIEVGQRGQRTDQAPRTQEHEAQRCRGTVKWFSDAKGYGFIRGDDGRDAFVHYSAITKAGLRTLVQGQIVEYEVQLSSKGLQAASVTSPGSG